MTDTGPSPCHSPFWFLSFLASPFCTPVITWSLTTPDQVSLKLIAVPSPRFVGCSRSTPWAAACQASSVPNEPHPSMFILLEAKFSGILHRLLSTLCAGLYCPSPINLSGYSYRKENIWVYCSRGIRIHPERESWQQAAGVWKRTLRVHISKSKQQGRRTNKEWF